jgi:hypothetical protein
MMASRSSLMTALLATAVRNQPVYVRQAAPSNSCGQINVRRAKACIFSGCESRPVNLVPAVAIGINVAMPRSLAPTKVTTTTAPTVTNRHQLNFAQKPVIIKWNALPVRRYASRAPAVLCRRIGQAGAISFAIACRGGHFCVPSSGLAPREFAFEPFG